jgi:HAD superfamily hydrolase (TIGR01509 family)
MKRCAYAFDVEGTLIDCVPQTLQCWVGTFLLWGREVSLRALQAFSGMDGNDMLRRLAPDLGAKDRKKILKIQQDRYEADYLKGVVPFPNVDETLQRLHSSGLRIALVTDCKGAALSHYRALLGVDEVLDALVCGDDARKGKPDPALIKQAINCLRVDASDLIMVGDTPYDALAAIEAGASAIGLITGGFSRDELQQSGCRIVLDNLQSLTNETLSSATH